MAHGIGFGTCTNANIGLSVITSNRIIVAQDFGCPLHEAGEHINSLYQLSERIKILKDYTAAMQQ